MSRGVGSLVVAERSVPPLAFEGDVNRSAVAITTAPLITILLIDFIAQTPSLWACRFPKPDIPR
jgi:hypothetical protein